MYADIFLMRAKTALVATLACCCKSFADWLSFHSCARTSTTVKKTKMMLMISKNSFFWIRGLKIYIKTTFNRCGWTQTHLPSKLAKNQSGNLEFSHLQDPKINRKRKFNTNCKTNRNIIFFVIKATTSEIIRFYIHLKMSRVSDWLLQRPNKKKKKRTMLIFDYYF